MSTTNRASRVGALVLAVSTFQYAAAAAPVECSVSMVVEQVHPQLAYERAEYAFSYGLDSDSGRWVMSTSDPGGRVFFDGTNVVQLRTSQRRAANGSTEVQTNAVVHYEHEGVPITLDRELLAVWFALGGRNAFRNNEGKPFPNLHGQYIYDINSHCCVVTSEWSEAEATCPARAVFRYSQTALEAASLFLSEEEISDDPVAHKAMRDNYLSLASQHSLGGEFTARAWIARHGVTLPGVWEYEVRLLGEPSIRFTGRITAVKAINPQEFVRQTAYDAMHFASVTDYRFLPTKGLDFIRYDPRTAKSHSILKTNESYFSSIVVGKVHDTTRSHAEANPKRYSARHLLILAVLLSLLLAPLLLFCARRARCFGSNNRVSP